MSDRNFEQEALQNGWKPQEQWDGDPERWVDAETFVRRGEEILPIVRAENKKLKEQLAQTAQMVQSLQQKVNGGDETIKALQEAHEDTLKRALTQQRLELTQQLKQAQEEGDAAAVVQLEDQLEEVKAQQKELKDGKKAPAEPQQVPEDPLFTQFKSDNDWFGVDRRKTNFALAVGQELAAQGLMGKAFYDKIKEEVAATFGPREEPPTSSKVEPGGATPSGDGKGSSGKGRSYGDLPAEAKEACDRFGKRLVGEGKAYKDIAAWRAEYARQFFSGV